MFEVFRKKKTAVIVVGNTPMTALDGARQYRATVQYHPPRRSLVVSRWHESVLSAAVQTAVSSVSFMAFHEALG
jgi:hypothetical protein